MSIFSFMLVPWAALVIGALAATIRTLSPAISSAIDELIKQASWSEEKVSFFDYRDKDQVEVDILLESDRGGIVCIDV